MDLGFLFLWPGKPDVGIVEVEGAAQVRTFREMHADVLHVGAAHVLRQGFASSHGVHGEVIAAQVAQAHGVTVLQVADDVLLEGRKYAFHVVLRDGALLADVACHAVKVHEGVGFDGGVESRFGNVFGILSFQYNVSNHVFVIFVSHCKSTTRPFRLQVLGTCIRVFSHNSRGTPYSKGFLDVLPGNFVKFIS